MVCDRLQALLLKALDREQPVKYALELLEPSSCDEGLLLELARRELLEKMHWELITYHCSDELLLKTVDYWSQFSWAVKNFCARATTTSAQFARVQSLMGDELIFESLLARSPSELENEDWMVHWRKYAPSFGWREWRKFLECGFDPKFFFQHFTPDNSMRSCLLLATYLKMQKPDRKLYEKYHEIFVRVRQLDPLLQKLSETNFSGRRPDDHDRVAFTMRHRAREPTNCLLLEEIFEQNFPDYSFSAWVKDVEEVKQFWDHDPWVEDSDDEEPREKGPMTESLMENYYIGVDLMLMTANLPHFVEIMHHMPFSELRLQLTDLKFNVDKFAEFLDKKSLNPMEQGELWDFCIDNCRSVLSIGSYHLHPETLLTLMEDNPEMNFDEALSEVIVKEKELTPEFLERYRKYVIDHLDNGQRYITIDERCKIPDEMFLDLSPKATRRHVEQNNLPRTEEFYRKTEHLWFDSSEKFYGVSLFRRKFLSAGYRRDLALKIRESSPIVYQRLATSEEFAELELPISLETGKIIGVRKMRIPEDQGLLLESYSFFLKEIDRVFERTGLNPGSSLFYTTGVGEFEDDHVRDFVQKLNYETRQALAPKLLGERDYWFYLLRFADLIPGELEETLDDSIEQLVSACQRNLTYEQLSFILDRVEKLDDEVRWKCYSQLLTYLR